MEIEDKLIEIPEKDLAQLKEKAKNSEYYRGRVEGLEYVIDMMENVLTRRGD